jgi:hypothetical protein
MRQSGATRRPERHGAGQGDGRRGVGCWTFLLNRMSSNAVGCGVVSQIGARLDEMGLADMRHSGIQSLMALVKLSIYSRRPPEPLTVDDAGRSSPTVANALPNIINTRLPALTTVASLIQFPSIYPRDGFHEAVVSARTHEDRP